MGAGDGVGWGVGSTNQIYKRVGHAPPQPRHGAPENDCPATFLNFISVSDMRLRSRSFIGHAYARSQDLDYN